MSFGLWLNFLSLARECYSGLLLFGQDFDDKTTSVMRKVTVFICLISVCLGLSSQILKMPYDVEQSTIQYELERDSSFSISGIPDLQHIISLGVDAEVTFIHPSGVCRIILQPEEGDPFLIARGIGALAGDDLKINLENASFETIALPSVNVRSIDFELKDCSVKLGSINYSKQGLRSASYEERRRQVEERRIAAIDTEVLAINRYNTKWNIPWVARRTKLSELPYAEKRRILKEFSDEEYYGIEYYGEGVYVHFPILEAYEEIFCPDSLDNTPYAKSFSWRNRHGINWNTPAKAQWGTSGCWAFSVISTLEAYYNLWRGLVAEDLDLSEQDMVSCSGGMYKINKDTVFAGYTDRAVKYAVETGVSFETENPWQWKYIPCERLSHTGDKIRALKYGDYHSRSATSMIDNLIKNGPLVASVSYYKHNIDTLSVQKHSGHAMSLVGYGVVGDEKWDLFWPSKDGSITHINFDASHPFYGKVYWEFKNSFGEDHGDQGYMKMLRYDGRTLSGKSLGCSISTQFFMDGVEEGGKQVVPTISDNDGDGYYFWGIGPKPEWAPDYIPDLPDGDDSDQTIGSMDAYGNGSSNIFGQAIDVTHPISVVSLESVASITVRKGGRMYVYGSIDCIGGNIVVESGGELVLMGGTIYNVDSLTADLNSKITIVDEGRIILSQEGVVTIKEGASMNVNSGGLIIAPKTINIGR